jgi:hypothetical protein
MKITLIAARLHRLADRMDAKAASEGDYEVPDEMVFPLIINAFTDDKFLPFSEKVSGQKGIDRCSI